MTGVVRPFRALVIRQESAAENVSQMFDALPASERRARVVDTGAYEESAAALYVYRLRRGHDQHVSVVGEVSTEAFIDGRVRGHEAVQPERVAALVDHYSSATVRSELVALLHRSGPALDAAIAACVSQPPVVQFTGPDEWEQTVWRVPESANRSLSEELSRDVLYVADGHHRVAASLSVWQREGRPAQTGLMCAMFPFGGLRLLAFHRRVTGPVDRASLLRLLTDAFDFSEITHPDERTGCFGLYVDGRWYDAAHTGDRPPGAAGLDIAILNEEVLGPLLGLDELAASRVEITSALSSLAELTSACDEDGGALFALRAPGLEQLTEVADRGEVMPPKTTYFDPKPYAGIFLR